MTRTGKKFVAAREKVEAKLYSLEDAIRLLLFEAPPTADP